MKTIFCLYVSQTIIINICDKILTAIFRFMHKAIMFAYMFLSLFLSPSSFCLTIAGVHSYCCHLVIHNDTLTFSTIPLDERSARRRSPYQQQHTILTRDKQPRLRRDSNPQSQQESGHNCTPQIARPLGSAMFTYMLR
jgi:hypothetical protein